jgi:hypothetical protein
MKRGRARSLGISSGRTAHDQYSQGFRHHRRGVLVARQPDDHQGPRRAHRRCARSGRFRQGTEDFIAGPGTLVWAPRESPHAFTVQSPTARALVIVTPGGFEQMFAEGGVPAGETTAPPKLGYDPDAARALAEKFGFDVIGPQLT